MLKTKSSAYRKIVYKFFLLLIPFTLNLQLAFTNFGFTEENVKWRAYSDLIFKEAKRLNRPVLLNLEAIWCHWCHVMAEKTYHDPGVIKLINDNFIAVKVDQDSRPDLSARYNDYGWPATIIFNAQGAELRKIAGYIEAQEFIRILSSSLQNPNSIEYEAQIQYARSNLIPEEILKTLEKRFLATFDLKIGGLNLKQRFLDGDTVEYALSKAVVGDVTALNVATKTLDGALALIDPVWGGAYQYSTHSNWNNPHFEKIAMVQATNLKIYSLASAVTNKTEYTKIADKMFDYLITFLISPQGSFYTSQDADLIKGRHSADYFQLDDKARRAQGIPAIDKNIYARENGWFISALLKFSSLTGNKKALKIAFEATNQILISHALNGGGFSHTKNLTDTELYLGDTLAMGDALLSLYAVTAERSYLKKAEEAASFIESNFTINGIPGFVTTKVRAGQVFLPKPNIDENILAARFLNLLSHYTGNLHYRELAFKCVPLFATPDVAFARATDPGILITNYELTNQPIHITVVGYKDDLAAKGLFDEALKLPTFYKRTEWWDKGEGPMPNPDVQYPQLNTAAAFVCTNKRCSLPIFDPAKINSTVKTFIK